MPNNHRAGPTNQIRRNKWAGLLATVLLITRMEVLKRDDCFEIIEELWDARGKWWIIGLGLKISRSDLEAIKQSNADVDDQFRSMLLKWLQNGEECTWEALCQVLSARPVGYRTLAREIEQKYTSKLPSRPPPQTEPQVAGVSCKGVVDNETSVVSGASFKRRESPDALQAQNPPYSVLQCIFNTFHIYHAQ